MSIVRSQNAETLYHHLIEAYGIDCTLEEANLFLDVLSEYEPTFDPEEPQGNKTLFKLAGGAVGALASAFIPGLGTVLAISIGLTVFGLVAGFFKDKKNDDNNLPSSYLSTGAQLAQLNQVVPIAYGERGGNGDPFGGVRVSPDLVNAWLENINGTQYLNQVFCLSVGQIGAVDLAETLINDQIIGDVLLSSDYTLDFQDGTQTANMVDWVSQIIAPNINNRFGVRGVALENNLNAIGATPTAQWSASDTEDYQIIEPSQLFQARSNNTHFKVADKDFNTLQITFDTALDTTDNLYMRSDATYLTSRKVDRCDFFFRTNLWQRTNSGKIRELGSCFDVFATAIGNVNRFFLGRFFMSGKAQNGDNRHLYVECPAEALYKFEFVAVLNLQNTRQIRVIADAGTTRSYSSSGFKLSFVDGGIVTDSQVQNLLGQPDDNTRSTDSGFPLELTTVNEILTGSLSYEGFAMVKSRVQVTERFSQEPRWSFLITQGRLVHSLLLYGESSNSSVGSLTSSTSDFTEIQVGDRVQNLEDSVTDIVVSVSGATVELSTLSFEAGDRFLITRYQASSYLPDIINDLFTSDRGGLANVLGDPGYTIDYDSFIKFKQFCVLNNFHWNSVASERESIALFAARNAPLSLGLSSQVDGLVALLAEDDLPITDMFTPGTTIRGTYRESFIDYDEQSPNRFQINWIDGSDAKMGEITSVFDTAELTNGSEPLDASTAEAKSIVSKEHAERFGAFSMQSIKRQSRVSSLSTDIDGLSATVGSRVYHAFPSTQSSDSAMGSIIDVSGAIVTVDFDTVPATLAQIESGGVKYFDQPVTVLEGGTIDTGVMGLQVGGQIILGNTVTEKRIWRVTKVSPDPMSNRVDLEFIEWDAALNTTDGLTIEHDPIALPTRYSCASGVCTETQDPLATFATLEACEAAIFAPGVCGGFGFNAGLDACELQPVSGATYSSLQACEDSLASLTPITDDQPGNNGLIQDIGLTSVLERTGTVADTSELTDGVLTTTVSHSLQEVSVDFKFDNFYRRVAPSTLHIWMAQPPAVLPATNSPTTGTLTIHGRTSFPPSEPGLFDSDTDWTLLGTIAVTAMLDADDFSLALSDTFSYLRIKWEATIGTASISEINLFGGYRLEA